ncbi:hypothetical protein CPAR01_11061 [Colletotrichum paranaense]|uniref:Uncharacterized protein n=1 Tax=Colletotrichum paranaense TaxID=1914294 RepID=A0ABQ9SAK6_9PEZI|nr:uncharacterized protein CPAR01_11061 [Colletotrichum paranaense]KAK1531412.1 hypothetical protein CPAR01_11061 [Colletotrichum paranaense]
MNQHVEAPVFVPSNIKNQDSTTSSNDSASTNSPDLSCLRGSGMLCTPAVPSPLRPALRLGCPNPRASVNTTTNPNSGWSAAASPLSFEQLYTEKAYLTASLSTQGEREIDLMRKLSTLQENVDSGLPSDERRKARKKIALLKSKIVDATAQKKVILLRLGDIYVELQSRGAWMQIQHELYERRYAWWSVDSPSVSACATTPSDVTSTIPTPLDASSPIFFPAGCHPVYNTWDVAAARLEGHVYEVYDARLAESWADFGQPHEVLAEDLGNHGLQFIFGGMVKDSRQGVNEDQDQVSSEETKPLMPGRRSSLPSLKSLWRGVGGLCRPGEQENEPVLQAYQN